MPFVPDDASKPTPGFVPDTDEPKAPAAPVAPTPGFVPDKTLSTPTFATSMDAPEPAAEPEPDSITEDLRRAGNWLTDLPGRAVRGGMNLVEKATDMPITRMYARAKMDANKVSPGPLAPMFPTSQEIIQKHGGPNLAEENKAKGFEWSDLLGAFETEGGSSVKYDRPSEAKDFHADFNVPGLDVSARQIGNAAAHTTLGRTWQAGQRNVGRPVSEMALQALQPAINTPATEQNPIGPEANEMLARELLSCFAGEDFRMGYDTTQYKSAVDQLEQAYGIEGAAFVQSFAHELCGLPLYLITSGAGEMAAAGDVAKAQGLAAKAAQASVKGSGIYHSVARPLANAAIKDAFVEGGVQGFLQGAAKDGEDAFSSAGYGALLGGIIGTTAGIATAKKVAQSMSQDAYHSVMMSRQTTNDFLKELDDVVAKKPAPKFEAMVLEGRNAPDFDIKVTHNAPIEKPTGTYLTVDDTGQLVARDFKVRSVKKTQRSESAPSKNVQVMSKGSSVPVRTIESPGASSIGEGLQVRIQAHDTPIQTMEDYVRFMRSDKRSPSIMRSQAAEERLAQLQMEAGAELDASRSLIGTGITMAPESLAAGHSVKHYTDPSLLEFYTPKSQQAAFLEKKKAQFKDRQASLEAGTKNERPLGRSTPTLPKPQDQAHPVVVSASPAGDLEITAVSAMKPDNPTSREFFRTDNVVYGGEPARVVRGGTDNVLINLGGHEIEVPGSALTKMPKRFERMEHGGRPFIEASPRAEPGRAATRDEALVAATEGGIGIPDVMRMTGRADPAYAAHLLQDLKARGIIKETGPGVFEPTRPAKPKGDAKPGYAVFIGTGGINGLGEIGIIRGKDPRTPGNWLVEIPNYTGGEVPHPVAGSAWAKTKHVSVTEDAVRSMRPVGLADKSKVSPDIDMYGWNKPMPPQFYQMSKATRGDQELLTREWSRTTSQPGIVMRSAQAIKEAFGGAMHTAARDIRMSKGQLLFNNAAMMRSEGLSLANRLGRDMELGSQASHDLTKVLESTRARSPSGTTALNPQARAQWVAKYPKEANAVLGDFKRVTAQLDEGSKWLANRGITNIDSLEQARALGLEEEYLTRVYQAFMMPRTQWAEYAKKNMTEEWNRALDWLYRNRPEHNNDFGHTAAEFDKILRLDNPIRGLQDAGYIKGEGAKKLMELKDVPAPLRALLGEHKDAAIRLAFSSAYQRQVIKSVQAWDAIAAAPSVWSPGWRPDMTLQVPDRPTFGNARGGFVADNKTMRQLLGDRPLESMADSHALLRAVGWVGRKWKAAHTVYNQVSWVNNAIRNLKGVVLSGGLTSPGDFQGFRDAARMLADYHNDPTIFGPNKLLVEAMDFDAVGPGMAGSELSNEQKRFSSKMLRIFEKSRSGPTPFLDALAEAREMAMSVPEKIHNGYDFTDRWAKFGSYLNLRREFIAMGMSEADAAAKASLRVNQSFQNFPRTANAVRSVSSNAALVAPFLSSKMEDMRINATAVKRLLVDGEVDLLGRLVLMGAMFGGAKYLAGSVRRANGISDEEDEDDKASIPLRTKERHPWLIGSLDRDSHGRRTFMDLTQYEDMLMAFRGNVQDPLLARILFNNLEDVTGQDTVMGQAAQDIGEWSGALHPTKDQAPPRPDQTGPIGLAQRVGQGFVPQGLMSAMRANDAMTPSGRLINPEALTPDQALVKGLTGRIDAITGPQTDKLSAMERAQHAKEGARNVGAAALDAALQKVDAPRREYMIRSNVRELKKSIQPARPLHKPRQ